MLLTHSLQSPVWTLQEEQIIIPLQRHNEVQTRWAGQRDKSKILNEETQAERAQEHKQEAEGRAGSGGPAATTQGGADYHWGGTRAKCRAGQKYEGKAPESKTEHLSSSMW